MSVFTASLFYAHLCHIYVMSVITFIYFKKEIPDVLLFVTSLMAFEMSSQMSEIPVSRMLRIPERRSVFGRDKSSPPEPPSFPSLRQTLFQGCPAGNPPTTTPPG